jgi:anti-sigma regulatory factor (Ser/Thr protein kinase)
MTDDVDRPAAAPGTGEPGLGEELSTQAASTRETSTSALGTVGLSADEPGRDLPAEPVLLEQDFDVGSLFALRAAVSAHAAAAGLSGNRLYDVVTVAHELAANAVRHGAGHGRLRLWVRDGVLLCEVSDDGPPPPAPRPGDEAVWQTAHGHGLWVISQVADQFTIDRGPATTATAAFTIGADLARDAPADGAGSLAPARPVTG